MENFTNKNPVSVNPDEFQEDGNDSDLEGRLYAEIYYSNEIHDPGEDFENSIKTIQDIKNASKASKLIENNQLELGNVEDPSNSSEKNCFPRNGQTNLVSAEKEMASNHIDKNLNLKALSNNFPKDDSNKVFVENLNPQENPNKNCTPQQKTPKNQKQKNETHEIMIDETQNFYTQNSTSSSRYEEEQKMTDKSSQVESNSLTTSMTRKRTLRMDKNSGNESKRRSLESDKSVLINTPKSVKGKSDGVMLTPVLLNSRKSSDENHVYPLISPATMALLFPSNSKEGKSKVRKKKKKRIKKPIKATNLKGNSKLPKKAQKLTNEDEMNEVNSSGSSNNSSNEDLAIIEMFKVEERKQSEKLEKEMPNWLDICSDSDESILEVPVPPKPLPPVINLNDSESICDSDSSSSNGIYDLNSKSQTRDAVTVFTTSSTTNSKESSKDNSGSSKENAKVISMDNSIENFKEIFEVDSGESSEENLRSRLLPEHSNPTEGSDSSYSDFPVDERIDSIGENLILNCTEVQKGAKSLEEIKKLRKNAVSAEVERCENESTSEYYEYVEPLNDLVEPSTSKASESFAKNKSHKNKNSEKNRKSSKEQTDEEYFFEPMPDKIKAFYNHSWGGEEFSVEDTQRLMRKDPRCWAILDEDWKPNMKRQRYFLNKTKCSLCRQPGHLRANCPEPKKAPVCHMCGSQGHQETRCPHKVCLTCGTKQNTFRQTCEFCRQLFCTLCRSRGHKKDFCPDLWRQYHHTTSETDHQRPKNSSDIMKPSNSLFCCNCTMRGHESSTCNKYRWTQHFSTPSHITSYYNCSTMLQSSNSVEVVNLTESPGEGESSRNTTNDIDLETLSEGEMPETPENDNSIMSASNFEEDPGKILFEVRAKLQKNAILKEKHKYEDRIILSDVQGANLEGLIAGTFIPNGLQKISRRMRCDICITLLGTKVVMLVTYYVSFAQREFFVKFIKFWVQLSDKEKQKLKYLIPMHKQKLISKLDVIFKKLRGLSGDIEVLWKEVESFKTEIIKEKINRKLSKKERRQIVERDNRLRKIVQLLYKKDCSVEKGVLPNLRKLYAVIQKKNYVSLNVYFQIFYYYSLIFSRYRPSNLEEMIGKYLALRKGTVDRSINNSVSSEDSVVNVEKSNDEDLDDHQNSDQEYNNQERQKPVPQRSFQQNRPFPSIPALLENNPCNFPPRFYGEQSTSSPGNHNTPQRRNQRSDQFEFPTENFIPISNYHPSEFLEPSPQFNRWGNSRQYARNPMHNFRTFNPRAPQTSERLVNEACYLLNTAQRFNTPQLIKAGIQLQELINQNRLQRKHINNFRHLMNSENARGFR